MKETMDGELRSACRQTPEGVVVEIWVAPGASRTGFQGLYGETLKVRVGEPAESGKANRAVAALLSELTGVPAELIRGGRTRRKLFLLRGADIEDVVRSFSDA